MAALPSMFAGITVEETVPAAVDATSLRQASILTGRRSVKVAPQTGVSSGPGQMTQFVISDSTGLLDPAALTLSFTGNVPAIAGATYGWFDEGPSMFRRIQIMANGNLIEDIDLAGKAANIELLSTAGKDFYDHDASHMNYYKFNETLTVADSNNTAYATSQNDVTQHAIDLMADVNSSGAGNGVQMAWPLGMIAPSFRNSKYYPLRNMGEITISITWAAPGECIWANGANAAAATYTLNDIYLTADLVTPHPSFASLLDKMCMLESEPGLVIPYTSRLCSAAQSIGASPGALSENTIVSSRATQNLRRAIVAVQPTAGIASPLYPSASCFPDAGFSGVQWRIGSQYWPQVPCNSLARAALMTSSAWGEPYNVGKSAVYNRHNYDTTTKADATALYVNRPGAGGQFNGTLANGGNYRYPFADFAPKAICFDSFRSADPLENDGANVLGNSGSQVVTTLRLANPEAVTPLVILEATRFLVLKDGGLKIQGA